VTAVRLPDNGPGVDRGRDRGQRCRGVVGHRPLHGGPVADPGDFAAAFVDEIEANRFSGQRFTVGS
jgi:hypothetical protein